MWKSWHSNCLLGCKLQPITFTTRENGFYHTHQKKKVGGHNTCVTQFMWFHPLQCMLCDVHCGITHKKIQFDTSKGTYYAIYKSHKLVNYLRSNSNFCVLYMQQKNLCLGSIKMCVFITRHILIGQLGS